jgi:CHASE3 domain sensor protein
VAALGLAMIVGWHAHWPRLLQVFPEAAPVQYNAALCFILCGVGLCLLPSRLAHGALWPGGIVALLTTVTLLEYLAGRDFGVDQFLFKPYFEAATAFPGRMAPLSACCFIFFGAALSLASAAGRRPKLAPTAGLLACITAVTGIVALLGYVAEIDSAYSWGADSRMAFNTAVAFIALGSGLFVWSWQTAARQNNNFLHWAPIAAALTLIVMVGLTSIATVRSLRIALGWRAHTYDVLLTAESFLVSVTDIQRGARGYVLAGKPSLLAPHSRGATSAPQQIAQLIELTRDNLAQQQRLKALTANLANVLAYHSHLINARDQHGLPASIALESNNENEEMMDRISALMDQFIQEEQRLLVRRSAIADADFHSAARLLGFGSVLAAIFFVSGSLLVRHEVKRRHRTELELREATDNVQTLSGLLPICAHCKSIRDNKGYWTRIEAYIQERSEATFSHALCEKCIKELYPAIADGVLSKLREATSNGRRLTDREVV